MMDWKLPRQGACRCGEVRIEVRAAPLVTMACHCTGCQKMSSSAYSLSAAIPAEGFAVTEGEPVVGGLHGPDAHHYFCPRCMTWMFTRAEGMDWFVNVRPTLLEGAGDFAPYIETWVGEKLPFAETGAVKSYEALPPMEDYEGLMAEFRGWR
ncbi:MAG: GFA family protein [Aquamicrobium sp.]|uniref:GFA family protein n=1 Tax=Mesorhizobium sp. Pch-S TaxID=2082387 RepID=UPI0010113CF4|nr:GFA family protein [Mesorhizobium sp. Pch-S]MBR2687227.1 GFA family protein [Aquamicrobium sp.]QAZ44954.1 aldehyde-activating protein [Mesorhizobium sp. Pch-S]